MLDGMGVQCVCLSVFVLVHVCVCVCVRVCMCAVYCRHSVLVTILCCTDSDTQK